MKGIHYPQELIDKVLEQIKTSGKTISQICSENNLNQKTVYGWIKKHNLNHDDQKSLLLENQRLKREKQELIELIGRLAIDVDKLNKKKDKLLRN
ncbi:MAG: transposase [Candidatus Lokiarchaeota archaeon]|nr:transposase [Candidatus Lokiarchaeota archaeon]